MSKLPNEIMESAARSAQVRGFSTIQFISGAEWAWDNAIKWHLAKLAARGGESRSKAKQRASCENGLHGGRPKGVKMTNKGQAVLLLIPIIGFFLLCLLAFTLWGCPQYNVYNQKMEGEAQLAHAEYSKKVQVQDALGKLEAAKSLADAEVARARGVAQANVIIGDSLKNNESYLRWLWIEGLKEKGNDIIYVPTEAGLPILEAGRRRK